MMMNEFGVPMNDAEMAMHSNPGKVMLQQQLATSGMESQFVGALIGAAVSVGTAIWGGNKAANAARESANASNEASQRQLGYDTQLWELTKGKIVADRDFAIQQIMMDAANERRLADHQDRVNLQQYQYQLKIRDREQGSLDAQFDKSNAIFALSTSMNSLSAQQSADDEIRKFQEIQDEAAFDRNEQNLDQLITEGKMRARGTSGRSAAKGIQATQADYGRQIAMINQSVDSGGRNARAALAEIARDRTSADLSAFAQKMLDPGVLPDPIEPFATPTADRLMPRELVEGDFGPAPVLGAYSSPSAAANRAWGTTISGIAGQAGNVASGLYNAVWGKPG